MAIKEGTKPDSGSALCFANEWISMAERGYELLPENLNLARAYVAMVEHTTAVEAEKRNLEEQLETVRRQGGWAAAEMHARTADRYEAALKRIAYLPQDYPPDELLPQVRIAREALALDGFPASRQEGT